MNGPKPKTRTPWTAEHMEAVHVCYLRMGRPRTQPRPDSLDLAGLAAETGHSVDSCRMAIGNLLSKDRSPLRKGLQHGGSLAALMKKIARSGGRARAKALTPAQRARIARKASRTRWAKQEGK